MSKSAERWRISDALWAKIEPLLPPPPAHPLGCHRPRVVNRRAMEAIFFIALLHFAAALITLSTTQHLVR